MDSKQLQQRNGKHLLGKLRNKSVSGDLMWPPNIVIRGFQFRKTTEKACSMVSVLCLVILCLVFLETGTLVGQTLTLDNTFNPTDVGSKAFGPQRASSTSSGSLQTILKVADGKFLVGGEFPSYNSIPLVGVARISSDGTLDDTFIHNGITGGGGFLYPVINSQLEQPDGKLIIAGHFSAFSGTTRNGIVRLTASGALDNTFNPGTGIGNATEILDMALQPDGKIVITGTFTTYNGATVGRICRLNSDGSLDTSFIYSVIGNTGADTGAVKSIQVSPDGKFLIGGTFTSFNGVAINKMLRLNSDGSIDVNWNISTGGNGAITKVSLLGDGKVLVTGAFSTYNGLARSRMVRLTNSGVVDGTFVPPSINGTVQTFAIQADGNIIVGGDFTTVGGMARKRLARILSLDGTLDTNFDPGIGAPDGVVNSISIRDDGIILVGGTFTSFAGVPKSIVFLSSGGNLEGNLNSGGTGANGAINTVRAASDGKLFITGYYSDASQIAFTGINNAYRTGLSRLTAEGDFDASYNPGGAGFPASASIRSVLPLLNGKVMVGGSFNNYNGLSTATNIIRLNNDGTKDATFNPGTGANNQVLVIASQTDDKLVLGGYFTSYNGSVANKVARVNADGSLDGTFNVGGSVVGTIYDIKPLSDGRTLVVGAFSTWSDQNVNEQLVMLQSNGTKDPAFAGINLGSTAEMAAILNDGKFLVVGAFPKKIARINADGTLDESFNASGSGANQKVTGLEIQPDGKIVIWGNFTSFNGVPRNNIARLNSDGSLDEAYDVASGANGPINSVILQSSKYIIAGDFTSFNGTGKNRLARINLPLDQNISFDLGANSTKTYGAGNFSISATGGDSGSPIVYTSSNTDVATISNGTTVTIVAAGETIITASQEGAPGYFAATPVEQTLTINKATLTAIADDKNKSYGDANPAFTITYTGFVGSDDASMIDTPPSVTTTATGTSNVGAYDISPSGGTDNNYSFGTYTKGTLTINKATLTLKADNKSRPYGDPNPAFTITYTGLKGTDNGSVIDTPPTLSTSATASSSSGSYAITLSGGTDNNYSFGTPTNGTLTVEKANLKITAVNKTRKFGQSNPSFDATYEGFKNSETASTSGITGPSIGTTATVSNGVGEYPITVTGGDGGANYILELVPGKLTIEKASTTIQINGTGTFTYNGSARVVTATTIPAGLTTSITYNGSPNAPIAPGSYEVVATCTNSNYTGSTSGTLIIEKAPAVIQLTGTGTFTYNGNARVVTAETTPAGMTTTVTYNGSLNAPIDAGTYTVVASASNTNYEGSMTEQLIINKADQIITFTTLANQTMGAIAFTLSAQSTSGLPVSFASGNSNKLTIAGTQATLVGAGLVTITAQQSGDGNYNAAVPVERSICINPAKPTLSVSFTNAEAPVLTSSSSSGNNWFRNTAAIANASGATYTASMDGSYQVRVQVDDCVSEFSNEEVILITGDRSPGHPTAEVKIYPNPVTDYLFIETDAENAEVVNGLGITIGCSVEKTDNLLQIGVQDLAGGVYFLRVRQSNGIQNIRFIKR